MINCVWPTGPHSVPAHEWNLSIIVTLVQFSAVDNGGDFPANTGLQRSSTWPRPQPCQSTSQEHIIIIVIIIFQSETGIEAFSHSTEKKIHSSWWEPHLLSIKVLLERIKFFTLTWCLNSTWSLIRTIVLLEHLAVAKIRPNYYTVSKDLAMIPLLYCLKH